MDAWYTVVRSLQDESENKYLTRKFCEQVFHELYNTRIREKQRFKNRMGTEFETWIHNLTSEYSEDMVLEIINDEAFWSQTLAITQGV